MAKRDRRHHPSAWRDTSEGRNHLGASGAQLGIGWHAIYEYYAGTPPRTSDAMAIIFLDLLFLGMPAVAFGLGRNPLPNIYGIRDRIVLSYDNRDVTRGIFDEFDELPPDGQSGQRRWGSESTVSEK